MAPSVGLTLALSLALALALSLALTLAFTLALDMALDLTLALALPDLECLEAVAPGTRHTTYAHHTRANDGHNEV